MTEYPFCPECGKENTLIAADKKETIDIKGTPITVDSKITKCTACEAELASFSDTFDVIEKARDIYRQMRGIPSPQAIRAYMDKFHFSLRDMEALTGIAFKTVDRYLKGAIPDPSNAKLLNFVLQFPEIVLTLMNKEERYSASRFEETKSKLKNEINENHSQNCPRCSIKATWYSLLNGFNEESISESPFDILSTSYHVLSNLILDSEGSKIKTPGTLAKRFQKQSYQITSPVALNVSCPKTEYEDFKEGYYALSA